MASTPKAEAIRNRDGAMAAREIDGNLDSFVPALTLLRDELNNDTRPSQEKAELWAGTLSWLTSVLISNHTDLKATLAGECSDPEVQS